MAAGWTKNRLAIPPIENPMSCVDMTISHWSINKAVGQSGLTTMLSGSVRMVHVRREGKER
jgi:hypothetical protein